MALSGEDIERVLLANIGKDGSIPDTGVLAKSLGINHDALVGPIKSLQSYDMITVEVRVPARRACPRVPPCPRRPTHGRPSCRTSSAIGWL